MLMKMFYSEELKKTFAWIVNNRKLWRKATRTDTNTFPARKLASLMNRLLEEEQYILIFVLLCGDYAAIDTEEMMFQIYSETILDDWNNETPDRVIRQMQSSIARFEQDAGYRNKIQG